MASRKNDEWTTVQSSKDKNRSKGKEKASDGKTPASDGDAHLKAAFAELDAWKKPSRDAGIAKKQQVENWLSANGHSAASSATAGAFGSLEVCLIRTIAVRFIKVRSSR